MGMCIKVDPNGLVVGTFEVEDPIIVKPKTINYLYKGITNMDYLEFDDEKKDRFLFYIKKVFHKIPVSVIAKEFNFKNYSDSQDLINRAKKLGMECRKGAISMEEKDTIKLFKESGIIETVESGFIPDEYSIEEFLTWDNDKQKRFIEYLVKRYPGIKRVAILNCVSGHWGSKAYKKISEICNDLNINSRRVSVKKDSDCIRFYNDYGFDYKTYYDNASNYSKRYREKEKSKKQNDNESFIATEETTNLSKSRMVSEETEASLSIPKTYMMIHDESSVNESNGVKILSMSLSGNLNEIIETLIDMNMSGEYRVTIESIDK